jgi:hypothetical protein
MVSHIATTGATARKKKERKKERNRSQDRSNSQRKTDFDNQKSMDRLHPMKQLSNKVKQIPCTRTKQKTDLHLKS